MKSPGGQQDFGAGSEQAAGAGEKQSAMLGGAKRLLYLIEKHKVKYLPKIKLILRSASGDIIRGFSPQSLLLKAIPLVNSSPFGVPRRAPPAGAWGVTVRQSDESARVATPQCCMARG